MEQRAKMFDVWSEPFVTLHVPKIFHLRRDPFERADENANSYRDWWMNHLFMLGEAQQIVASQIESLAAFRQKPASFNLDRFWQRWKIPKASPNANFLMLHHAISYVVKVTFSIVL